MAITGIILLSTAGAIAAETETAAAPQVKPLAVEDLGVPVRTMRRAGDFLVPKAGNAGWWLITSYNPMRRSNIKNQIYVIDLNAKTYRIIWGPAGGGLLQSWGNKGLAGPDERFYIAQYGQVGLWELNRKGGTMQYYSFPDVTERVSPLSWQWDPERKTIFMGTASYRAYLVSFNTTTHEWRNYGIPDGVTRSPRYIWSMAVGEKYIYSGMGKNPWRLVATDRETGKHTELLAGMEMEYLTVRGGGKHCTASVEYKPDPGSKDTATRLFTLENGAALAVEPTASGKNTPTDLYALEESKAKKDAPPAEAQPEPEPAPRPELVTTLARPTSEGKAQVWFKLPDADWDCVKLEDIQTAPWKFNYLLAMDDGRLIGAPRGYEDIFIYDPASKKTTIVGKATMSMGEMVSTCGKIYMCGYPGTIIHEYDPAKPWTYFTTTPLKEEPKLDSPESNPRFCARLGDICHTHHVKGTALGADGFIYVGGHAERQDVGGGLMWWDPAERKAGGIREPFELQDCADICAARGGNAIVYSSRPVSDPRKERPTPATARLFVLEVLTKKIIDELTPLPEARTCGPVVGIDNRVYGVGATGEKHVFYVIDLDTKEVVHTTDVASRVHELALGPDGRIYAFINSVLTRIDPESFVFTPLGLVENPGRITFCGNDLYLTGRNLHRIRDVPTLGR